MPKRIIYIHIDDPSPVPFTKGDESGLREPLEEALRRFYVGVTVTRVAVQNLVVEPPEEP